MIRIIHASGFDDSFLTRKIFPNRHWVGVAIRDRLTYGLKRQPVILSDLFGSSRLLLGHVLPVESPRENPRSLDEELRGIGFRASFEELVLSGNVGHATASKGSQTNLL